MRKKVKRAQALLYKSGYLRLNANLLPEGAKGKGLSFFVEPQLKRKQLWLKPELGQKNGNRVLVKRKAMYSNAAARSPQVAVRTALRFLAVRLPEKSREVAVRKRRDGILVIQF